MIEKILGRGSCHDRCVCEVLCLEHIPCGAAAPYTLVQVAACAQMPWWEELPSGRRGCLLLKVSIPVTCTFLDANGARFQSGATIERTLEVRLTCGTQETWRYRISVQACVRLIKNAQSCDGNCFNATIELVLEAFVTLLCPVSTPQDKECCFDNRPLFPPPIRRPCK